MSWRRALVRALTWHRAEVAEYLSDAHAMEKNVLRQLDTLVSTTDDPELRSGFERHRGETEQHIARLERRLEAYDKGAGTALKDIAAQMGAFFKGMADAMRGDKDAKNARDAFTTEHFEIATYELLERLAMRAGDAETAEVARMNRGEEEAMARALAARWDRVIDLVLASEGIDAPAATATETRFDRPAGSTTSGGAVRGGDAGDRR